MAAQCAARFEESLNLEAPVEIGTGKQKRRGLESRQKAAVRAAQNTSEFGEAPIEVGILHEERIEERGTNVRRERERQDNPLIESECVLSEHLSVTGLLILN